MDYAKYIDHTFLKAEGRKKDIDKLIEEAKKYQFKTVCVNSSWIKYVKEKLQGEQIGITSVVGFPLGACATQAKVHEAKLAIDHGASEIDMVMNIGRFKDKQFEYVLNDIKSVKKVIGDKVLKVIIETALLTPEEIAKASSLVIEAKADFVKTSTGFSYRGASFEDIKIIKKTIKDKGLIKAAGGIKTLEDLKKMIALGANRIGTSSGVKLLEKQDIKGNY